MANNKYLDQGGLEYLWSKIKSFINTKTTEFVTDATLDSTLDDRLEYINYISNESVSSQSKSVSSSTYGETKSVSITNSGFEYGKAKRLSLTVTAKVSGNKDLSTPNKITVQVKLPSGGTWFLYYESSVYFLSGGSVVTSFSAIAGLYGSEATTTKTYTFYLAKVK